LGSAKRESAENYLWVAKGRYVESTQVPNLEIIWVPSCCSLRRGKVKQQKQQTATTTTTIKIITTLIRFLITLIYN
jgi:hypothetical protein